ncbi:hypothetical protein I350_07706 [Cryptococcus amylolentus CBS 6273]|uniref:Transcription factor domain-containing protein n=1 Tax=Cryptococcus amylolentus CBS 6273 TaxID=1296118 RepID=A0A1E3JB39_9TREE|nr:hypothetical protein I350_07706 [Cryptococcus amylolentus CBS 6273]
MASTPATVLAPKPEGISDNDSSNNVAKRPKLTRSRAGRAVSSSMVHSLTGLVQAAWSVRKGGENVTSKHQAVGDVWLPCVYPSNWRNTNDRPTVNLDPPDYLALIFWDAEERELMQHFMCFGTINLCAIPQADKPIQFFDISYSIAHPRGSHLHSDALLISLLSIAAIHRSSLLLQQQKGYLKGLPRGTWARPSLPNGISSTNTITRLRAIGTCLSQSSMDLCLSALLLKLPTIETTPDNTLVLLTSLLCAIISQVMIGGIKWKNALTIACDLVSAQGGPAAMLEAACGKPHFARTRAVLEQLVLVDVWRCLATGQQPQLLAEPFQPWWYDYATAQGERSSEDFRNKCGMDAGVLELANRVNILVHEQNVLQSISDQTYIGQNTTKANDLLLELDIWVAGEEMDGQTPLKIILGNQIMIYTLRVVLLVDLLHHAHSHEAVQTAACKGLRLLEQSRSFTTINMLIATIILGSMMQEETGRQRARSVITSMRSHESFSYDVEEAFGMLNRLYALRDDGHYDPSWRSVVGELLLL